ncbi:hypothetical protein Vi05172_g5122 [Venturia inaequalis]|nr:hypothetical protein Vi05172_g5122 [Venturia inaequalis]
MMHSRKSKRPWLRDRVPWAKKACDRELPLELLAQHRLTQRQQHKAATVFENTWRVFETGIECRAASCSSNDGTSAVAQLLSHFVAVNKA